MNQQFLNRKTKGKVRSAMGTIKSLFSSKRPSKTPKVNAFISALKTTNQDLKDKVFQAKEKFERALKDKTPKTTEGRSSHSRRIVSREKKSGGGSKKSISAATPYSVPSDSSRSNSSKQRRSTSQNKAARREMERAVRIIERRLRRKKKADAMNYPLGWDEGPISRKESARKEFSESVIKYMLYILYKHSEPVYSFYSSIVETE